MYDGFCFVKGGLITYDAIPDIMRNVGTSTSQPSFKARHYNFTHLTIGSYKVSLHKAHQGLVGMGSLWFVQYHLES